jgi:hypothetical protein
MSLVFLNASYLLMLLGLSLRDVVWLRGALAGAQAFFILFGLATGNSTIVCWNGLFLCINTYHVVKHLRERRPVELPAELVPIHRDVFQFLNPKGFLKLWSLGRDVRVQDRWLFEEGTVPMVLMFIREGEVEVHRQGEKLCRLGPGHFLGEMEFITGEPLNVGFRAHGSVRLQTWTRRGIAGIGEANPQLCIRIQGVLGRAVLKKLQSTVPSPGA